MSGRLIAEGLTVLKEVFNRPYRIELTDSYPGEYKYEALTDDGRKIEVFIDSVEADYSFLKGFGAFDPEVAKRFKWNPNQIVGRLDFAVDGNLDVTGEGDATRILATVIEAMKDSIKRDRDLVGFMFQGFGGSRVRLYTSMIRRLAKKHNLTPVVMKDIKGTGTGAVGMFSFLGHKRRAPWMFIDEVREDIGPKTSKQSIRPFMKNAARGLGESEFGNEYYRKGHKNHELGVRFRDRATPYIGKAQMRVTLGPEDAFS